MSLDLLPPCVQKEALLLKYITLFEVNCNYFVLSQEMFVFSIKITDLIHEQKQQQKMFGPILHWKFQNCTACHNIEIPVSLVC